MRSIKRIVVHCTGTPKSTTVQSILNYWRYNLGWKGRGYHYIIDEDGELTALTREDKTSNGVKGYNRRSIHVAYIGGNNGIDTRTNEQKTTLIQVLKVLKNRYPKAEICGHRDFPRVAKTCPNFDVKTEYESINK